MAGLWGTVWAWLEGGTPVPPPPPPRGTGPVWPDLYGEEAAQEALQDARDAYQPTEADLADPDQEWIDVRRFGEAGPHYVRGRS